MMFSLFLKDLLAAFLYNL